MLIVCISLCVYVLRSTSVCVLRSWVTVTIVCPACRSLREDTPAAAWRWASAWSAPYGKNPYKWRDIFPAGSFTLTSVCHVAVMFVGSFSRTWTWGSGCIPVRFFAGSWVFRSGSLISGAGTSILPTVWRLQECRGQTRMFLSMRH